MTTRNSIQRAAELSALLARHSSLPPAQIAERVLHLQRIARQLKAIEIRACNGIPVWRDGVQAARDRTPEEYQRDKTRAKKLAERASSILLSIAPQGARGWGIRAGGDPCGPCLSLFIAGERGDGWGDGYAVY